MSASTLSIPTIDNSRYVWRESPEDRAYYTRAGWGPEMVADVWNRYNHAEQNLFLGVYITLSTPTAVSEVLERARDAWVAVRFSTPTIAAHTEQDKADNTLLTYRVAAGAADAQAWARRTIRFHETHKDLDELRFEVGQRRIPEENGDQTFLYLISRSDTSYGVLMHTTHVPFDAGGTKIIMNRFLNKFAQYLADPSLVATEKFAWGTEAVNLTPAAGQILGPNEVADGSVYEATLTAILTDWVTAMPVRCPFPSVNDAHLSFSVQRMHGLKARNFGPGPTRRLSYTFSLEESLRFIQFARSKEFTVTHLGKRYPPPSVASPILTHVV